MIFLLFHLLYVYCITHTAYIVYICTLCLRPAVEVHLCNIFLFTFNPDCFAWTKNYTKLIEELYTIQRRFSVYLRNICNLESSNRRCSNFCVSSNEWEYNKQWQTWKAILEELAKCPNKPEILCEFKQTKTPAKSFTKFYKIFISRTFCKKKFPKTWAAWTFSCKSKHMFATIKMAFLPFCSALVNYAIQLCIESLSQCIYLHPFYSITHSRAHVRHTYENARQPPSSTLQNAAYHAPHNKVEGNSNSRANNGTTQ